MVKQLHVRPSLDTKCIDLWTEIESKALAVKSVQFRRETRHRSSMYSDPALRLCEVEELCIEPPTIGSENKVRAYSKPRRQMVAENRVWWEVSMSSKSATEMFQENQHLELGEMAKWTQQDLIQKGVIRELSLLTMDVVTRIDSIGYHNKRTTTTSAKESSSEKAKISDNIGFW